MTTETSNISMIDLLPQDVQDTIYRYKHQLEFREVLKQIKFINILACKHHNIIFWDAVARSNMFTFYAFSEH